MVAYSSPTEAVLRSSPSGVVPEAEGIEPVQEADVFLLQGHGAVAVSQGDIYDAYLRAAYIEELAQLYYNALCAGQGEEPYFFPPEELQKWEYPSQIKFPNK